MWQERRCGELGQFWIEFKIFVLWLEFSITGSFISLSIGSEDTALKGIASSSPLSFSLFTVCVHQIMYLMAV